MSPLHRHLTPNQTPCRQTRRQSEASEPRGRARPVIDLEVAVQQHHGRGHLNIVLAQDHLPIQHHAYENAARK